MLLHSGFANFVTLKLKYNYTQPRKPGSLLPLPAKHFNLSLPPPPPPPPSNCFHRTFSELALGGPAYMQVPVCLTTKIPTTLPIFRRVSTIGGAATIVFGREAEVESLASEVELHSLVWRTNANAINHNLSTISIRKNWLRGRLFYENI
jgi:hypothetical protein